MHLRSQFFQSRMNLSSTTTNVEDLLMQRLQLKHRFKPPLPAQSMGDHGRAPMEQMGQSKWVITVRAAEIHAKAVVASIEPLTFEESRLTHFVWSLKSANECSHRQHLAEEHKSRPRTSRYALQLLQTWYSCKSKTFR